MDDRTLLHLLKEEQDHLRVTREALRDLLHTIENVRDSGGWSAVEESVVRARAVLKTV